MDKIPNLINICAQVRRDILRMVTGAESGHPGGALGCVELLVALFFSAMRYNGSFSKNPKDKDVFILSNGHICPVLYSVMARRGLIPTAELSTFRALGSRLQGHPSNNYGLPGVYISTGSLGQGLSVSAGLAYAKRLEAEQSTVFCLTGDGELQEGQIWEALNFINHYKIHNLITIVDYNGQQIDGPVAEVMSLGNLELKFQAFGCQVLYEPNGNDMEAVLEALRKAKGLSNEGRSVVILLKTEMGKGVDFMEGTHLWHGKAPSSEQLKRALNQLPQTLGDY